MLLSVELKGEKAMDLAREASERNGCSKAICEEREGRTRRKTKGEREMAMEIDLDHTTTTVFAPL